MAELGLSAAGLAAALFTVPMVVGVVLEPVVLLASERMDRRRLLVGALLAMAAGQLGVLLAVGPVSLALALGGWGLASGVATSLAEVALVARTDDPDRAMTRWGLAGALGDLAAPAALGAVALLGGGWREATALAVLVSMANAAAVAAGPALRAGDDEQEEAPAPLREVARNRALWAWLGAATACTLLDELLLSLGSLWLDGRGLGVADQAAAFAALSAGMAAGHLAVDRLAGRLGPRRILLGASALCVPAFLGFLVAGPTLLLPVAAALGAAIAPMWSLCTARAYAVGGRPGAVAALGRLLQPAEVLAPLALGLVADAAGLAVALLLLLVQPLVVAMVARRG